MGKGGQWKWCRMSWEGSIGGDLQLGGDRCMSACMHAMQYYACNIIQGGGTSLGDDIRW